MNAGKCKIILSGKGSYRYAHSDIQEGSLGLEIEKRIWNPMYLSDNLSREAWARGDL
jgi:hypothetical protein